MNVNELDSATELFLMIFDRKDPNGIRELLAAGADVNACHPLFGYSPLTAAAGSGNREVCQLLVDHGADVNQIDIDGQVPLCLAAHEGRMDICADLIEQGADVHAKTGGGWTALHGAAVKGDLRICELLVEHGADPTVENEKDMTAVDLGRVVWMNDDHGVVRYLESVIQNRQLEHNTAQIPAFPNLNDPATLDQVAAQQAQPKRRGMRL
jgi:ankyrin repeat protein